MHGDRKCVSLSLDELAWLKAGSRNHFGKARSTAPMRDDVHFAPKLSRGRSAPTGERVRTSGLRLRPFVTCHARQVRSHAVYLADTDSCQSGCLRSLPKIDAGQLVLVAANVVFQLPGSLASLRSYVRRRPQALRFSRVGRRGNDPAIARAPPRPRQTRAGRF